MTITTTATYTDGDIKYCKITKVSPFPTTKNNTQCTNVLLRCQNTVSLIGADVSIRTLIPPTFSSNHKLTVRYVQFFSFIGVSLSSILIINIIFCMLSINPNDVWYKTHNNFPIHPLGYGWGFFPLTYSTIPLALSSFHPVVATLG